MFDNGLVVKNDELKRYEFPTDIWKREDKVFFPVPEARTIIEDIMAKKISEEVFFCASFLLAKWNSYTYVCRKTKRARKYVFCYKDIMRAIGYSDNTNADSVANWLDYLYRRGWIFLKKCNPEGKGSHNNFFNYKELSNCLLSTTYEDVTEDMRRFTSVSLRKVPRTSSAYDKESGQWIF